MATQTRAGNESVGQRSTVRMPRLPLGELGFKNVPAVPVDAGALEDTLLKLAIRRKQVEQPLQGMTKVFTIGGKTARAYNFLFGTKPFEKQLAANESLRRSLSRDPSEIMRLLVKALNEPPGEAAQGRVDGDDLTALALDDPKQWSMSWSTLPDVFTSASPLLDELAATVDVTQPDKATESFFPMMARHASPAFNLILPKKVRDTEVGTWRNLFGAEWTPALDAAAKAGLLYVIDFRIYETLQPQTVAGIPRFTPSTVTVLVQDPATKALTPELVRVAGGDNEPKVFSRHGSTTASAWVYALQAAKVSVTVFGIWLGHVHQWHLVTAAMLMTMFENLSANHPVRKVLEPQSNYVIPFDNTLLLRNWSVADPPTSIVTQPEFQKCWSRTRELARW